VLRTSVANAPGGMAQSEEQYTQEEEYEEDETADEDVEAEIDADDDDPGAAVLLLAVTIAA